jgi:DNA mismatch repair protein MutS
MGDTSNLTPGMQQYMQIKEKYPDYIILFRMGDFYETFYEDAMTVSSVLNITLTSRGKDERKAPLAGIPYHSLDRYLGKLLQAGYKIALCEQVEDPKLAKGLVKREVVRILTPGTVVEDSILTDSTNNYLACLYTDGISVGLAFADISTGEFVTTETATIQEALQELARKKVAELLIRKSYDLPEVEQFCKHQSIFLTTIAELSFQPQVALKKLQDHFKAPVLERKKYAHIAAGALLQHLQDTQRQQLKHLRTPEFFQASEFMLLDASTIRNLELLKNIHDKGQGSLLSILDKTITPMGARLLKQWVTHPLKDLHAIQARHGAVRELKQNGLHRSDIRKLLRGMCDVERVISRLSYNMVAPKEILNLNETLKKLPSLKSQLVELGSQRLEKLANVPSAATTIELISRALAEESQGSAIIRSGQGYSSGGSGRREIGIIKKGFNAQLDELYELKFNTSTKIKDLEKKEQELLGVPLKVGFNSVFGYYIEVTTRNKDSVPARYIRKQTTANGERFITEELKEFEEKLLHAEEKIIAIESKIIDEVVVEILKETDSLQKIASAISEIDVLSTFAEIAFTNNYVAPEMTNGYELSLKECRHPVIESLESRFIPNDCMLDENEYVMLITGPNMAGKSTFMRQVALALLMAQCGSFVAATYAKMGIVDQIFTRVGAYDDLSTGQSTFMVEMKETAHIVNTATEKSFIVLDEIGRGTSTFDGVAIAWSVAEHILTVIKAKTLFATHYHVLTKLEEHSHKGIVNYNVAVAEEGDDIIFLHKINRGGTDKSYGIHVGKLAGLPPDVIERAKEVQLQLEGETDLREKIVVEKREKKPTITLQKDLFGF